MAVIVTPSMAPFLGTAPGVGTFSTSTATTSPSHCSQGCLWPLTSTTLYLEPGSRLKHTPFSLQSLQSVSGPMK